MPQPTIQQVHVSTALTQVAIGYSNAAYIARQIFPIVPVTKDTDQYYIFTKADWFRDEALPVAPGNGPQESGYGTSTSPYVCIQYGSRIPLPYRVRDNADNVIQPRTRAVRLASDKVELALEIRVATLITTAGNWTTTASLSSGSLWSADTSDPFSAITTAKSAVRDLIGRDPNTIVMGAKVWDQLWKHPDVTDRLKYTVTGGAPTPQQLGSLFMIDRVLIGAAIKNTANEGATASYSSVWGKDFWIGYVSANPAVDEPSAGYVFRSGNRIAQWLDDALRYREVYDVLETTDEVVSSADAGYLIEDAVV